MTCTVCSARMSPATTDLPFKLAEQRMAPFKLAEQRIVIIKQLPVLQCTSCREYLIEDAVMARIEALLHRTAAGDRRAR